MKTIWGSDGTVFTKSGSTTFVSGRNGGQMTHSGNMTYTNRGSAVTSGNMTFGGGGSITHSGNTWYAKGRTYTRSGNMLYGNGKSWTGVTSDADVRDIILNDM